MSKTADHIIKQLEGIEQKTGYGFFFLNSMYVRFLDKNKETFKNSDVDTLSEFAKLAEQKAFGDPEQLGVALDSENSKPVSDLLAELSLETGYDIEFLTKQYLELVADGDAPWIAYEQVRDVSEEQDW